MTQTQEYRKWHRLVGDGYVTTMKPLNNFHTDYKYNLLLQLPRLIYMCYWNENIILHNQCPKRNYILSTLGLFPLQSATRWHKAWEFAKKLVTIGMSIKKYVESYNIQNDDRYLTAWYKYPYLWTTNKPCPPWTKSSKFIDNNILSPSKCIPKRDRDLLLYIFAHILVFLS